MFRCSHKRNPEAMSLSLKAILGENFLCKATGSAGFEQLVSRCNPRLKEYHELSESAGCISGILLDSYPGYIDPTKYCRHIGAGGQSAVDGAKTFATATINTTANCDLTVDTANILVMIDYCSTLAMAPSREMDVFRWPSYKEDLEVLPDHSNTALITLSEVGRALSRNLGRLECVEAVFVVENDGVICSYTVVNDFEPEIVSKVMDAEERVERLYSSLFFDFRIRASQGRSPETVVPINATPIVLK